MEWGHEIPWSQAAMFDGVVREGDTVYRKDHNPLLFARSSYPKSVKSGIVNTLLRGAVHRSFGHEVARSRSEVTDRLLASGFSMARLTFVTARLLMPD